MRKVLRAHAAESSDSEMVQCPECGGDGVREFKGAKLPCECCVSSGFLLRQRTNDFGIPERVQLVNTKEEL
jgi:DnaJ-class molecular chaperone